MPRRLVAVLLPLAALCLVRPAAADAPAAARLASVVRSDALAYAAVEGFGTAWAAPWRATAVGRLLEDPETRAFLDPALEEVGRVLREALEPDADARPLVGAVARVLEAARGLQGEAAACLVNLDPEGRAVLAAGLDFGEHLRDFVAFLERMRSATREGGSDGLRLRLAGGVTLWSVGSEEGGDAFHAGAVGTMVYVSNDRAWVEERVVTGGAPVASPLLENASFARAQRALGPEGPGVFAWADVPALLARVPDLAPGASARAVAEALGLDAVTAAAYGAAFRDDGFRETLLLDAPRAGRGLLPALRGVPADVAAAGLAPSDALVFASLGVPLTTVLPRLEEAVARLDPDEGERLHEALARARDVLGFDVETEIAPALTGEVTAWVGWPRGGGLYPEVAVALGVRDPAAFEARLARATDGICEELGRSGRLVAGQRTIPYHGTRLHCVDVTALASRDLVPFTPTWAVLDRRVVVTAVPHAMKEIVLRREAGDGGLAARPVARALLALAAPDVSGVVHLDVGRLATGLYDTLAPLAQTIAKPNVFDLPFRLDPALLPPTRAVRPYARGVGVSLAWEPQGLRMSVQSPLPLLPLAALAAVAALWSEAPPPPPPTTALPRAAVRTTDPDEATREVLSRVASAVREYVALRGVMPARLDDLVAGARLLPAVPTDRWGRALAWSIDDASGRGTLRSAGADGVMGTSDDLTVEVEAPGK